MSVEERLRRFSSLWTRELTPYKVEEPGGSIKLDAMENPYPIPVGLREAWKEVLANVEPNRYPDTFSHKLKRGLRDMHQLPDDIQVALGNGSDELIHLLCLAFSRSQGACVLSPEPTFVVYGITSQIFGMEKVGVDLTGDDFSLNIDAMLEAIDAHKPALIFIASPNNPTGNCLDDGDLGAICDKAPGLVVLDEAYYRFAGRSKVSEVAKIENLVVLQTMSKIGLAALRVGMLFGSRDWVDIIERLRMPYNISAISQAGALFAIEHESAFQEQIAAIIKQRENLFHRLKDLDGVSAWPSTTNFILFRALAGTADQIFESLKGQNVLVKNVSGGHPLLQDCLRVTVGTPRENELFFSALQNSL